MDQIELVAQLRSVTGKKVRALRAEGIIPLVVYGRTDPVSVQASEFETRRVVEQAGGQLISLQIEGEDQTRSVLARELQRDAISGLLLHVDLHEVDVTERMQVEVPLAIVGEPKLVASGQAVLLNMLTSVEIECLPTEIVQSIEVDVSGLVDLDDAVYVRDLIVPESIEMVTSGDEMIARMQPVLEEEEEEEEEALFVIPEAEVEIIQRGRAEEEEA